MSDDIFLPLTVPVLGDGRVVVQRNMFVALQLRDLFEFLEWSITRMTRFDFRQNVEPINRACFELLEGDVFCWWPIISVVLTDRNEQDAGA
jgi:hypothetical protein